MSTHEQRQQWRELAAAARQVGRDVYADAIEALLADVDALTAERDALAAKRDALVVELCGVLGVNDILTAERDALAAELERVRAQLAEANAELAEVYEPPYIDDVDINAYRIINEHERQQVRLDAAWRD